MINLLVQLTKLECRKDKQLNVFKELFSLNKKLNRKKTSVKYKNNHLIIVIQISSKVVHILKNLSLLLHVIISFLFPIATRKLIYSSQVISLRVIRMSINIMFLQYWMLSQIKNLRLLIIFAEIIWLLRLISYNI